MKFFKILISFLMAMITLHLSGCSYSMDIPQGNELEAKDLRLITIGMTKEEVGQIIGYPLLTDIFHENRWDYYGDYRPGYEKKEFRSHVKLYFEDDVLIKIDDGGFEEVLSSKDERAKRRMRK